MLELILSLLFSHLIAKVDLPAVENNFFVKALAENHSVIGGDIITNQLPTAEDKKIPEKTNSESLGVVVTATSGIVVDSSTGKVLWEKDSAKIRPIASLTKLMTALVFLDNNPGWDKEVVIDPTDRCDDGSGFLYVGESLSERDLFNATLVRSINIGAAALARSTGVSEEDFVAQMNAKAKKLGMASTTFFEPTGLSAKNMSTAEDLVILVKEALDRPEISQATVLSKYEANIINKKIKRSVDNTDWLLSSFLNQAPYRIVGGKTGYLEEAGYCLGLVVENGGHQVISVMLGSNSLENRFNDTKAAVDWVFSNYRWP